MSRSASFSSLVFPLSLFIVVLTFAAGLVGYSAATAHAAEPGPAPSLLILPASNHVTGLPYPARCALRHATNGRWLPDPGCTPGAASSAVNQGNIRTTICQSGYATAVRAPRPETSRVKTSAMRSYNLPTPGRVTTELDHQIPLELGGSNDVRNLWPEPSDIPNGKFRNTKDSVERTLHHEVCLTHPRITLRQAQNAINNDWTTALQTLHLK